MKDYQGWPNLHGYTPVGAGPEEWREILIEYRRSHEYLMSIRMGPGWNPKRFAKNEQEHHIFERVTVIVLDDHNGLCDKAGRYAGVRNPDDEVGEQVRSKQS